MTKERITHDADISSAGDDFHILWTIKKSLELLNFDDSGIKAVNIEGIELSESQQLDPTGKNLLGVDLSEYYGADNFIEAEKIIISQLKYSTVRSHKNYTIGELYIGKKSKSTDGSLIHRLASIFKVYLDKFGRESVLKKVKIKLVTNRNFNPNHLKSINDIKTYLLKKKRKISFGTVLNDNSKNKTSLKKLYLASKLSSTEFTDFIRLLDFNDCGAASRYNLKLQLYKSISRTTYTSKLQYNQLRELVFDKMMPEASDRRKIIITDVISSLGFNDGSIENLFPVPQSFEKNDESILREQLVLIKSKIQSNIDYKPICIHGGAGIGKSTIIQQIKKHSSEYNECITFDCYGAGSYQNSEDKRHLHKNALLQLSNTIAQRVGTDFLIIHIPEQNDVYIKEFRKRIIHAIEILRQRNEKATLTIIIDAADNSVTAAEKYNDTSFVYDVLNMSIPIGCNLIVTTRTHRKGSLKLPEDHISIKLKSFSLSETAQFVKKYFPKITDNEINDFHKYTNAIPRAQSYSIDLKKRGIKEVINFLKPNGKTVEDLILDTIKEAKKKVSNEESIKIDNFFKLLISLPRPVPLSYLSELLDTDEAFLLDISSEVWRGLIYENNHFEFRDEDFENYIRDNYSLSQSELKEVTKVFIVKAADDSYASINLGSLLFQSQQNELLKKIVLNREYLLLPGDPIKNRETYISRTKLAMKVAGSVDDNLTYFKLLFIAAEEAKKEKALTEMLTNYPDLVATFGDDTSLNKLKLNSEEKSWAGSFHMKLAGIYSRSIETQKTALKHLKTAKDWLSWRNNSVKKENLDKYYISSKDVAYYTEAVYRLIGLKEAISSLNSWTPRDVRLSAGNYLVEQLFLYNNDYKIEDWFKILESRIDSQIFLVVKAFKYKIDYNFNLNLIARKLEKIFLKNRINFSLKFQIVLVDFCELLIFKEIDNLLVINILNYINIKLPEYVPSFYGTYYSKEIDQINLYLKVRTLKASIEEEEFLIESILPNKFKDIDKIKDYKKRRSLEDDKKEFTSFYNHILPVFRLSSDYLSRRININDTKAKFKEICQIFSNDYKYRYESGYNYKQKLNYLALLLARFSSKVNNNELINILIKSFDNHASKIAMRFCVLEEIIHLKSFLTGNLKLLHEIDEMTSNNLDTSTTIVENYIKCTLLSQKIDFKTAEYYFNEAVKAVEEIDYEVLSKISCLSDLSTVGFENNDSKLAYELARFTEYSDVKLSGYDKKHFPYKDALIGISNLDFNSIFTTASRWHHRGVIDISKYIVAILKVSLKRGFISHEVGASLIPMYMYSQYTDELMELYDLILNKYDESRDIKGKTKFIEFIYRDCLLNKDKSSLNYIYDRIKSGVFIEKQIVNEIESYLNFRDNVVKGKTKNYANDFSEEKFKHEIEIEKIDLTSTRELEKAISNIIENSDSYSNRWKIDNFMSDIKDICLPNYYTRHMDAIIDIDSNLLSFYSFEEAIKERLHEWSFHPSLKQWKKDKFRYVILTWFENFDYESTLSIGKLLEFAKMFDFNEKELGEIIISILPEKIETLTDESIYSAFFLIKDRLTKNENTEIFNWILRRWNKSIKPNIGDGLWNEKLLPPSNTYEAVANTLRLYLGLPDKELRWQAIHSIRRLVNLNSTIILDILIKNQNKTDCIPFQNESYIFYWISAKLYLWIAIERLSKEIPEKLIEFKNDFILELQNKELPHVLIQFFIKRTCLNLLKHDKNIYDVDECKIIENSLVTKFEKVKEKRYSRKQRKYNSSLDGKWRFDFDSMDVLPYWYSGLGNIFNLSEYDVADIADKYIVEKWGYVGNTNEDDYTRNYEWALRDKRQGSNPRIESLDTYFEYHAMFCAANELLNKEAQLQNDDEGDYGTWEYWLKSKSITWDKFWKSDLRDPQPLLEKFWKNEYEEFDKEWRNTIIEDKFDDEIGFSKYYECRFIIPYGGFNRYLGDNSESVYIRSALVSEKGSEALLRAFQTTKNQHVYVFPFEEDEKEIEESHLGLVYKGWLKIHDTIYDGLDQHDGLSRKIGKSIVLFNTHIQNIFPIEFDSNFKKSYLKSKEVSNFKSWDETSDSRYRSIKNIESSGEILKVDINFILDVLKKENMNMIIKCQISKQLEKEQYRSDNGEYPWEHTKIYLLKSDGTVKTLRGRNFKIR